MTKTANYSANAGEFVRADTTAGVLTVSLPTAVGISGQRVGVKKVSADGNAVTIGIILSQTIDGGATLVLFTLNNSVTVVSDGSNWDVLA